jgi:hypothetical protein
MPHVEGAAIVTNRHASDEKLREAFQALADTSRDGPAPAELDQIWRAVSGELPASERRELVDRTASDPALAEAWRVAQELWRASHPIAQTAGQAPVWMRSWMAVAAVLVVISGITVGLFVQRARLAREETFRDPGHYLLEALVQADSTLPRDAFRLRWTPGPQGSRYQVRVTTEDLRILTTVSDLSVPELVVSRDLLSNVASGARVFWQVDVTLPGGETVSSQTFVVRVQ